MKMFWTYIVASKSGTLYVGMTNSLDRRMFEHKNKLTEGFTSQYGCDRLVWYEQWNGPLQAIRREKEIKGWIERERLP